MHGREGDPDLVHFDGREHHMRRVQRVDEVGRESRGLPLDGDGKIVEFLSDMYALQKSLHLANVGKLKGANNNIRRRGVKKTNKRTPKKLETEVQTGAKVSRTFIGSTTGLLPKATCVAATPKHLLLRQSLPAECQGSLSISATHT